MPKATTSFKGNNVDAQKAALDYALKKIKRINRETREGVKQLIVESISEGIAPSETARRIRSMIGLNARQVSAVNNYRRSLKDLGLTKTKIEELVDKYANKKLTERAVAIARTEIMDALNAGTINSWEHAKKEGYLPDNIRKGVMVTGDETTCNICGPLNGKLKNLSEDFIGGFSAPTFHPHCRCTVYLKPL